MRWMARISGIGISRRRAYRRVCDFSILDGYVEMRTFLLLRSRSVIESLLEMDMVVEEWTGPRLSEDDARYEVGVS